MYRGRISTYLLQSTNRRAAPDATREGVHRDGRYPSMDLSSESAEAKGEAGLGLCFLARLLQLSSCRAPVAP